MSIHSSADGYLECFHFLAIMKNAAINDYKLLLGISLRLKLLGHNCMFNHLNNYQTVSQNTILHFTFLPAMYKGPNVSTSLTIPVIFCLFGESHPSGYKVESHCGFHLHVPND